MTMYADALLSKEDMLSNKDAKWIEMVDEVRSIISDISNVDDQEVKVQYYFVYMITTLSTLCIILFDEDKYLFSKTNIHDISYTSMANYGSRSKSNRNV